MESNLVTICITAFLTVFVMLALLAAVMRIITYFFPQRTGQIDPVHIAAINSAFHVLLPEAKVSRIEELK